MNPKSSGSGASGVTNEPITLTKPMQNMGNKAITELPSHQTPKAQPSDPSTRLVSHHIAKSDSVLFVTSDPTHVPGLIFNECIIKCSACWRGPNRTVRLDATIDEFFDLIKQTDFSIIHIGACVGDDSLQFRDGELRASALKAMLRAYGRKPKLLVLDTCNSFTVGKAIEDSGVMYSIVATQSLWDVLAEFFFCEFYDSLYETGDVEQSFYRGCARVQVRLDEDPRSVLMLSQYNVT